MVVLVIDEGKMDPLLKEIYLERKHMPTIWKIIEMEINKYESGDTIKYEDMIFPKRPLLFVVPPRFAPLPGTGRKTSVPGFVVGGYGTSAKDFIDRIVEYSKIISKYVETPPRIVLVEPNPEQFHFSVRGEIVPDDRYKSGYKVKAVESPPGRGCEDNYIKDIVETTKLTITAGFTKKEGQEKLDSFYRNFFKDVPEPVFPVVIKMMLMYHLSGSLEIPWIPVPCRSICARIPEEEQEHLLYLAISTTNGR